MTIHDNTTHKVYFSQLLKLWYPSFTKRLEDSLNKHSISYTFIDGTKDIWMRDFMPIQRSDGTYVRYLHNPDYLDNLSDYKTSPFDATKFLSNKSILDINLNLDGGNIVRGIKKIICTNKIFDENSDLDLEAILQQLKCSLGVDEIIIIPKQPYDTTGHSDGLVRFIDDNHVLLSPLSMEDKEYEQELIQVLQDADLQISNIKLNTSFYDKSDWAVYMNYLQVGKHIFLPYKEEEIFSSYNQRVFESMQKIFPTNIIEPIYTDEIAKDGGALNCISWNIA